MSTVILRNFKRLGVFESGDYLVYTLWLAVCLVAASYFGSSQLDLLLIFGANVGLGLLSFFRVYCDIENNISQKILIENLPAYCKILACLVYFITCNLLAYGVALMLLVLVGYVWIHFGIRGSKMEYNRFSFRRDNLIEFLNLSIGSLPGLMRGPFLIWFLGWSLSSEMAKTWVLTVQIMLFIEGALSATITFIQGDLWDGIKSFSEMKVFTSIAIIGSLLGMSAASVIIKIADWNLAPLWSLIFVRFTCTWAYSNASLFLDSRSVQLPVKLHLILIAVCYSLFDLRDVIVLLWTFEFLFLAVNINRLGLIFIPIAWASVYHIWISMFLLTIVLVMALDKESTKRKLNLWVGYW